MPTFDEYRDKLIPDYTADDLKHVIEAMADAKRRYGPSHVEHQRTVEKGRLAAIHLEGDLNWSTESHTVRDLIEADNVRVARRGIGKSVGFLAIASALVSTESVT